MGLLQAARRKAASDGTIARLEKRGVYELVPITAVTAGQRSIRTQWVKNTWAYGTYISRLDVQGWSQAPGTDCGGIFASVCRLQSICMMLATAAELEHEVFMLDVQTAFLRAAVEENVFVEMALGYQI